MAYPKFYLDSKFDSAGNNSLIMRYSIFGTNIEYYTGQRINSKFYRKEDAKGKNINRSDVDKIISENAPHAKFIKAKLKQISLDAQTLVTTATATKIPITKEYVVNGLDKIHKHKVEKPQETTVLYDFITFYEKLLADSRSGIRIMKKGKKAGHRYSEQAIKNFNTSLSAIKRFLKYKRAKSLHFDQINKEFYNDFRLFCYDKEKKEISTFGGYIEDVKVVMDEAAEAGIQNSNGHLGRHFIIPSYESDKKALTLDELDIIHNHDFSHRPRFEHIRDLFLIGAYSALRFGNFNDLKIENIENDFIRVKQIKTGNRVTIPVIDRLKDILNKYDGSFPLAVSNQEFNRVIKEVVKEAGVDYLVDVTRNNGGIPVTTSEPIYELVGSHTARRTYATILFKMNIPPLLIMSATGHKTLNSFLKYIKATDEDRSQLLAEVFVKKGLIKKQKETQLTEGEKIEILANTLVNLGIIPKSTGVNPNQNPALAMADAIIKAAQLKSLKELV